MRQSFNTFDYIGHEYDLLFEDRQFKISIIQQFVISMKQLGSSKGFLKRNLLRPASGLSKEREYLKTVDISQSQPMISSTIRSELSVIQESISLLDKDKRIRSSQQSLEKSYVGVMRKWIRENGSLAPHFQKEDDDKAILKHMGAESYETGFRKLWKIICNLDLMISKIMELEIVHMVKYDEMFDNIGQDSEVASGMLSAIAKGGFNPAMFHVVRVSLERSNQLYAYASDLKRKNPMSGASFTTQNETAELIEQLKSENKKLVGLLNDFQNQPVKNPSHHKHSSSGTLEQLEEKYKQYMADLDHKISKLNQDLTESKLESHSFQRKLDLAEKELEDARNEVTFNPKKTGSGSYEDTLVEEMDKMKTGFERKIRRIREDHEQYERDCRRKEYQSKNQCDRMKWEKSLLLKKYELLAAASESRE